jgi:hypothetical protein
MKPVQVDPVVVDPRVRRVTEVPLVLRVPKALKDPLVFVSVLAPRRLPSLLPRRLPSLLPRRLPSPLPSPLLRRLLLTLQLRRRSHPALLPP